MAFDIFMYFPHDKEVKGETLDGVMSKKNAFELESFAFGATNSATIGSGSGGAGAGKAAFNDVTMTKRSDTATCGLFETTCTGNHFKEAIVELRRAGGSNNKSGATFLKVHMKLVVIKEMTFDCSDGEDLPTETINFAFGALKMEYFKQDAKGIMSKAPKGQGQAQWSQKLNEASYLISR